MHRHRWRHGVISVKLLREHFYMFVVNVHVLDVVEYNLAHTSPVFAFHLE